MLAQLQDFGRESKRLVGRHGSVDVPDGGVSKIGSGILSQTAEEEKAPIGKDLDTALLGLLIQETGVWMFKFGRFQVLKLSCWIPFLSQEAGTHVNELEKAFTRLILSLGTSF